jgi:osmotically-inducible protein OsmY
MNVSRNLSAISLCVLLGVAGGTMLAGCAGSPTSKSTGDVVDDSLITTKVKAKFVGDPAVSALNIKVDTFKGNVQLSGFANNATEMERAVSLARDVDGVKSVKNDIRLKTAQ